MLVGECCAEVPCDGLRALTLPALGRNDAVTGESDNFTQTPDPFNPNNPTWEVESPWTDDSNTHRPNSSWR